MSICRLVSCRASFCLSLAGTSALFAQHERVGESIAITFRRICSR